MLDMRKKYTTRDKREVVVEHYDNEGVVGRINHGSYGWGRGYTWYRKNGQLFLDRQDLFDLIPVKKED